MAKSTNIERITLDFKGAIVLDNGMVKVPATLTRAGVFPYMQPDGVRRLDLRPESEVFDADSMASFENVPLTNDHPYHEGGAVTAENAKRVTVGTVSGVHRNGMKLDATVTIYDQDTIDAVRAGKQQLSCGYFNKREVRAGFYPTADGSKTPYTHVQSGIRGNHVAIVQVGRAGPEARLLLDAEDAAVLVTDETALTENEKETTQMKTITLDSLPAEMPEASAAIVQKAIGDRDAKILAHESTIRGLESDAKTAKADHDKLQGTFDSVEGKLKEALDPAKLQAAVTERVSLESGARKILGDKTDLSKLTPRQVKIAVIGKLAPQINCDSKSDDYVDAAYEINTVSASKTNSATAVVAAELANGKAKVEVTKDAAPEEDPFEKCKREGNASKPWEFAQKRGA